MDLSFLPLVNAMLNGAATVLMTAGLVFVKRRQIVAHRACMIAAFVASCVFLVGYVTHKVWRSGQGGELHTRFHGSDVAVVFYKAVLVSHVALAVPVALAVIYVIRLGLTRRDQQHRRLARVVLPLWLYVSVTGVVIYVMLYHLNAAGQG